MNNKELVRSRKFYVYIYRTLEGVPIYVGKGMKDRFRVHQRWNSNNQLFNYLRKRSSKIEEGRYCLVPDIIIAKDEADAFEMEELLIAMIGRVDIGTGTLFNLTEGGEGTSGTVISEETRRKMSINAKNYSNKPEVRARRSALQKELQNTPERKKKNSEFHKIYQNIPEVKELNRIRSTGRVHSEETKLKMSEVMTGIKRPPEACVNIGLSKAGKPQNTLPCQFCNHEVSKSNLKRHEEKCEKNPNALPRCRANTQAYSMGRANLRSKLACSPESDQTLKPEELPPQS